MALLSKFDDMRAALQALAAGGRNPFDVRFEKILSATEAVLESRPCLLFGTNNYLGLTFDESCIAASVSSVLAGGTGTTGSRIANGTYGDHVLLERSIAEFYGKRAAMIFTTGYQANLGLISALARISTDASLGERVRLNSGKLYRALAQQGFAVGPEPNAIVALKMPDKETAVRFWNRLLDQGVYANLALPPATPASLSLIRCSISAAHSEAQIDSALSTMRAVGLELGILDAAPNQTPDQASERVPA